MIWKRIKNLWTLSEYHVSNFHVMKDNKLAEIKTLTKDFPTIQKKLAIIIPEDKDVFEQDVETS